MLRESSDQLVQCFHVTAEETEAEMGNYWWVRGTTWTTWESPFLLIRFLGVVTVHKSR